jgi:hypothetical protein
MKNKLKPSKDIKIVTNLATEKDKGMVAGIIGNFMATEVIKGRAFGLNTCLRSAIKLN